MVAENTSQETLPPTVAVADGQRVATPEEQRALIQSAIPELLTRDLPHALSGLAASDESLTLNRAAIAAFNTAFRANTDTRNAALADLRAERETSVQLRERAHNAERQSAVFESELGNERRSTSIRILGSSVGAVLLGLVPWFLEKAGTASAVLVAVLGAVLLIAGWKGKTVPQK